MRSVVAKRLRAAGSLRQRWPGSTMPDPAAAAGWCSLRLPSLHRHPCLWMSRVTRRRILSFPISRHWISFSRTTSGKATGCSGRRWLRECLPDDCAPETQGLHPPPVHPSRGARGIRILPPRRVVEMQDKVAVIRGNGIIEDQFPDALPAGNRHTSDDVRSVRGTFIAHINIEGKRSLRYGVTRVKDLGHDFVPEVELIAGNAGLFRDDAQTHVFRSPSRLTVGLAKLRNLVELALRRLPVDSAEYHSGDE